MRCRDARDPGREVALPRASALLAPWPSCGSSGPSPQTTELTTSNTWLGGKPGGCVISSLRGTRLAFEAIRLRAPTLRQESTCSIPESRPPPSRRLRRHSRPHCSRRPLARSRTPACSGPVDYQVLWRSSHQGSLQRDVASSRGPQPRTGRGS